MDNKTAEQIITASGVMDYQIIRKSDIEKLMNEFIKPIKKERDDLQHQTEALREENEKLRADNERLMRSVQNRISELSVEKDEILKEYLDTSESERDVLAERNIRVSMEIKFLNSLLFEPVQK